MNEQSHAPVFGCGTPLQEEDKNNLRSMQISGKERTWVTPQ